MQTNNSSASVHWGVNNETNACRDTDIGFPPVVLEGAASPFTGYKSFGGGFTARCMGIAAMTGL
jgi:hypothetical protein